MQRYFIDQTGLLVQDLVSLTADDSRHFLRVMRSQPGAKAWLVTGDGQCYLAQLEGEVDRLAQFRLLELQAEADRVELPVEVTIACGLSKKEPNVVPVIFNPWPSVETWSNGIIRRLVNA